ncbi:MAG: S8 family serine peptidase [Cyclobacteriaceae bacterium]
MIKINKIHHTYFLLMVVCLSCQSQSANEASSTTWLDPALDLNAGSQPIVVWFEDQFLENGDSFIKMVEKVKGEKRSDLRKRVIAELKMKSYSSFEKVSGQLENLQNVNQIENVKQHWIVNGFTCETTANGLTELRKLDGVAKIFLKQPAFSSSNPSMGPKYLVSVPASRFSIKEVENSPWNIKQIRAPEVWNAYGIIGEGTLNVVHDFGFKLDIPPLAETIYINDDEIPGNGIDDDENGYIDDYHGYHFDAGNANLNNPFMRRATIIHGNACAAMISGTFATGTKQAIGIAPGSKWAPVIGSANIEQAVEWAIEQGADTYSMSFSQPSLGEFRTHWRKVMEQGTFCGVTFISGAGNFAAGPNEAPVPVQMRNPEDIPNAVLGVAGVGEDGNRPPFSSQGPVEWNTHHYQDGTVKKPDFATLNYQISCVDPEGNLSNMAGGNSFAGPHMAGTVALMLSANPELNPWEVKEILIKTAKDIGELGFDYQSGHGFVNAFDAVTEVMNRMK